MVTEDQNDKVTEKSIVSPKESDSVISAKPPMLNNLEVDLKRPGHVVQEPV